MILKDIQMVFGFLTRIPVKVHFSSFDQIAKKMWLFPFVGFCLGLFVGVIGFLLNLILPPLLTGFLCLGILIGITGAHHTDGLFDFGDGLMVMGTPEKKIKVMHDVAIGAGGLSLGIIIVVSTGIALGSIDQNLIVLLCITEIMAKYALQVSCTFGKNAHTTTASKFIELNNYKYFLYSTLLSVLLIIAALLGINSILFIIVGIFPITNTIALLSISEILIFLGGALLTTYGVLFILNKISNKHFGGLTGDCLGAIHEIIRLANLITIIIIQTLVTT
ncbi:Adenosylcobinamide-GDP ribazoletransferase [Candidatus Lokiarchaeum ossiferum]|uniref:Adenosylcobinamide-GDP ribazoletransferase n=1 Tax=Candidatus Lokiarchaeum ossiferum TaxID=2951803 RepID=A0ABY6I187_9ARCH|nr:Adenosylcobinamide-GDP ribazoletransferase [Candidatus Lokiarchaeum sp. B-35]